MVIGDKQPGSLVSRFPSDLMKSTVVDESLSSYKPMYCSREYQTSTRLNQQYEKSTLNLLEWCYYPGILAWISYDF